MGLHTFIGQYLLVATIQKPILITNLTATAQSATISYVVAYRSIGCLTRSISQILP